MTKEQEEAIERCEQLIKQEHANWIGISNQKAIETVLNMLKEKDKEIESIRYIKNSFDYVVQKENEKKDKMIDLIIRKKDRQIDLMAECIDVELSSARLGTILNKNVKPLETYKEDIKQYFASKAEKE